MTLFIRLADSIYLVVLASIALLICGVNGAESNANGVVFPMYVPGTAITDEMLPDATAMYGVPWRTLVSGCKLGRVNDVCESRWLLPGDDASFCKNVPDYVSRTPYFSGGMMWIESDDDIEIVCGGNDMFESEKNIAGTTIVYTTDGTLPDVNGPSVVAPHTFSASAGEAIFLVARCLEPGKHPSRIAYVKRQPKGYYDCFADPGWKWEVNHKPLILPGCNAAVLGLVVCDGQTVVDQPPGTNAQNSMGTTVIPLGAWVAIICVVFVGFVIV